MSGYTDCACRDCFDVAMDGGLCRLCEDAGCIHANDAETAAGHPHYLECQRDDAYGVEDLCEHGAWVCSECGHGKGQDDEQ